MSYIVDFVNVSTTGLESSPVVDALAGLRANEARYFKNKYDHVFTVQPAAEAPEVLERVNRILSGRSSSNPRRWRSPPSRWTGSGWTTSSTNRVWSST